MGRVTRRTDFTDEERQNIAVFGTDNARAHYEAFGLTPAEERAVRRHFTSPGARVLDLGCGYGRTTIPLVRMGFRAIGVDIVPRMIEGARQRHPDISWALMSATDLAFRDASVDYVLFSASGLDC